MNWVAEQWLAAIPLVLPVALLVGLGGWWHRRRIRSVFGPELAARVLPHTVTWRRRIAALLALAALVLGCIALAEPAFDKEIVQVKTQGVDLVIALDLSTSMDATDVDPTRLERARREIQDLVDLMAGDRVAVVFFAGEAIGRLPLTEDYKAVEWILQQAETEMFKAQGSSLGKAIDASRELLARDEGKAGKAMVVFSDGETHDVEDAVRAANAAAAEGLVIYSVGIGDAAAAVPGPGGVPMVHQGKPVVSTPNFDTLREVASITGGALVKSVASASDMESLYRSQIRTQVQAVERETQQQEKWNTAFQYPLGLGLLSWLAGAWLGDGRRRFGAAAAVLLAVGVATSTAQAATLQEADELYRTEKFARAADAFEKLTLETPDTPDLYDRLGAARYRAGDFVGAARAFERSSHLRGGDADADVNAGNARYRAGQLEQALEHFERALDQSPGHTRAETNKQLVSGELATRRAEKPPPPPDQGDSKDEEGEGEGDDEQSQPQPQPGGEGEEPQDGESESEPGEGEGEGEGEPQDGEPEEGEPQDGEPQDGEGTGDPQDGAADADAEPGEGEGSDSDGGPDDEASEGVNPEDLDQKGEGGGDEGEPTDAEGATEGGADGVGEQSGNITPAQAGRMLDGVEEGRPRVQMVGRSSDKPW